MSRHDRCPLIPAPPDAPSINNYEHPRFGRPDHLWPYEISDGIFGYIARWDVVQKDGRKDKEIRPLTVCRGRDGRLMWNTVGFPEPRPLYRLPELLRRTRATVLVVEGEKTAGAAAELFPDFVATTAPHGAMSPAKADWSPLAGRHVVIAPDADDAGTRYATEVARLVHGAGALSVRILRPERIGSSEIRNGEIARDVRLVPHGWDLADALNEGWTSGLVQTLLAEPSFLEPFAVAAAPAEARRSSRPPRGRTVGPSIFDVREDGVYRRREAEEGTEWIWLCSRLDVVARTRDGAGSEHGRLLEWRDPDGVRHEWAMPFRLLARDGVEIRDHLLSRGVQIAPGQAARQALNEYLMTSRPEVTARCVGCIGWHEPNGTPVFVLPDGAVFGNSGSERIVYQTQSSRTHRYEMQGTLETWKDEIGRACSGNSRLVLAVSAAFAGPLLHLVGAESGGLHLYGQSSKGKSTILSVAGSVWGGGGVRGFIQSWRATDNGLEGDAAAHCDTLLCLDELSECDPRAADAAAYMLANGRAKARADRQGDGRPRAEWRLIFLSTGEPTLSERLTEDGKGRKARAGQDIRLLNVPVDAGSGHGAFEDLHSATGAAAFADQLKEAARRSYGTAGRAFVAWLATHHVEARETIEGFCREFVAEHCPRHADGQVVRAAGRFALLAAAGELGVAIRILPWEKGEAIRGVAACFHSWLAARGTSGPAEDAAALAHVRRFFELHGESRFTPWEGDRSDRGTVNRAGFRKLNEDGETEWFVLPEAWSDEVCPPGTTSRVRKLGIEAGWLCADSEGKAPSSHRLPGLGQRRAYHVTSRVLLEG